MVRSLASFVFFASLAAVTAAASGPTPALGSLGYEPQTASQVSVDVTMGQQKQEAILRRRSRGARVLLATSALAATLAMAFLVMHCFIMLKNSQHRGARLRRLSSDDEGACEQGVVEEAEEVEEVEEIEGAEGGVSEEAQRAKEAAVQAFREYITATENSHAATLRLADRIWSMFPSFPSLTSVLGKAIGLLSAMDQAATHGVAIVQPAPAPPPEEPLTQTIARAGHAATARTAAALRAAELLATAARLTHQCGIVPHDEDEQAEQLLRRAAACGAEAALLLRGNRRSDPEFLPPGGPPVATMTIAELSRAADAIGGVAAQEARVALLALNAASSSEVKVKGTLAKRRGNILEKMRETASQSRSNHAVGYQSQRVHDSGVHSTEDSEGRRGGST